jgi:xanthine dehydrogenase accessory factor
MLAAKGIPRHGLERICTPIGIPIGGESPEEIALSIVAELVCIRRMGLLHTRSLRKNMWD